MLMSLTDELCMEVVHVSAGRLAGDVAREQR